MNETRNTKKNKKKDSRITEGTNVSNRDGVPQIYGRPMASKIINYFHYLGKYHCSLETIVLYRTQKHKTILLSMFRCTVKLFLAFLLLNRPCKRIIFNFLIQ